MFTEKCKTVFLPPSPPGGDKGAFSKKKRRLKKVEGTKKHRQSFKGFFWSLRKEENYEHIEKNRMLLARLVWPKFRI